MKRCGACGEMKSLDSFNKKGEGKLQAKCKECNKIYLKEHYQKNLVYYYEKNIRYRNKYKKEIHGYLRQLAKDGCKVCGENDYRCLHFNHIELTKKEGTISHMVAKLIPMDVVKAEAAKCDVMCANCHAKHTADQFGFYGFDGGVV